MRLNKDVKLDHIVTGTHQRAHILIALITLGMVPIEFVVAFGRMQMPVNGKTESLIVKGMEVGIARNYVAHKLKESKQEKKPKYLFFYGDDMIPPWDALIRMYEEMETGKWDVLSGLYYWKGAFPVPLTWRKDKVGRVLPGVHYRLGEVISVDVTGMDFTLIKNDVFDKIEEPFFKTGPTKIDEKIVCHTEDVWFCDRVREKGLRIGVHTGVRVAHLDVKSGAIY